MDPGTRNFVVINDERVVRKPCTFRKHSESSHLCKGWKISSGVPLTCYTLRVEIKLFRPGLVKPICPVISAKFLHQR